MPNLEIERKFLVDTTSLPDLTPAEGIAIRQGYLAIGPDSEARVRSMNDQTYTLTVKTAGELVRGEFETAYQKTNSIRSGQRQRVSALRRYVIGFLKLSRS
ncbi:MAG TPA: hypothetical protein VK983_05545 [Candidatus Limnocylindrales bacterium]|nr:hypothetical protein [Candidatus Limnocylindrales bacterium]